MEINELSPGDVITWRCWHGGYTIEKVTMVSRFRVGLLSPDGHYWSTDTLPPDTKILR